MALLNRLNSMEEYDMIDSDAVEEPSNIAEATELESSLIDAQEDEEELNDYEEDLETAETAMESWVEMISCLENAKRRGGLDEQGAKLYELNRKHIMKTMGADPLRHRRFSAEDFNGSSSRERLTSIALEDDKNVFVEWWRAIVRFVKNAVSKTVDFLVGLVDASKAVENRAVVLMREAKNGDNDFEGKLTKAQAKKFGAKFRSFQNEVYQPNMLADVIKVNMEFGKLIKPLSNDIEKYNSNLDKLLDELNNSINSASGNNSDDDSTKKRGLFGALTSWISSNKSAKDAVDAANAVTSDMDKMFENNLKRLGTDQSELKKNSDIKSKLEEGTSDTSKEVDRRAIHYLSEGLFLVFCEEWEKETGDSGDTPKGTRTGLVKITLTYDKLFDPKPDDSKLFKWEDMSKDICTALLNSITQAAIMWKRLNDDVKKFNKTFEDGVNKLDRRASTAVESVISFFKRILSLIKSLFSSASGVSKWYKHSLSFYKEVLNVISIRMSDAPGDDKKDNKDDNNTNANANTAQTAGS